MTRQDFQNSGFKVLTTDSNNTISFDYIKRKLDYDLFLYRKKDNKMEPLEAEYKLTPEGLIVFANNKVKNKFTLTDFIYNSSNNIARVYVKTTENSSSLLGDFYVDIDESLKRIDYSFYEALNSPDVIVIDKNFINTKALVLAYKYKIFYNIDIIFLNDNLDLNKIYDSYQRVLLFVNGNSSDNILTSIMGRINNPDYVIFYNEDIESVIESSLGNKLQLDYHILQTLKYDDVIKFIKSAYNVSKKIDNIVTNNYTESPFLYNSWGFEVLEAIIELIILEGNSIVSIDFELAYSVGRAIENHYSEEASDIIFNENLYGIDERKLLYLIENIVNKYSKVS